MRLLVFFFFFIFLAIDLEQEKKTFNMAYMQNLEQVILFGAWRGKTLK
jgi:hypothetical protein